MSNRNSKNKLLNLFRKKRSSLYKEQLSPFNSFEEKEERAKYSYKDDNNEYFSERNRYFTRKAKLDENLPLSYRGSSIVHNRIYGHSQPPISIKYAHQKNILNKGKNLFSFRADDYSYNNNNFKSIDFDDGNLVKNDNNNDINFNIDENNKTIYQNNNQEINDYENPTSINDKGYNLHNDNFDDDKTNQNYIRLNYNYYSDFGSPITIINNHENNFFDETNGKDNSTIPDKYLFKSIFDYNSTKNFMKTFSPKNNKEKLSNFYFDKTYKPNLKLTRHSIFGLKKDQNLFGLKKDQNLLGELLQKIIKQKRENKHSISNHTLYKFYKDKNEKKINKIIDNFLNSSKIKYNKTNNIIVLPPNKFNFK